MLRVVCALIKDNDERILLAQRGSSIEHAGKWEFPGGKIKSGEDEKQAIQREIREELGAEVQPQKVLDAVVWQYPDKEICLIPIICDLKRVKFNLSEHQQIAFFDMKELEGLDILEADIIVINQLKGLL